MEKQTKSNLSSYTPSERRPSINENLFKIRKHKDGECEVCQKKHRTHPLGVQNSTR